MNRLGGSSLPFSDEAKSRSNELRGFQNTSIALTVDDVLIEARLVEFRHTRTRKHHVDLAKLFVDPLKDLLELIPVRDGGARRNMHPLVYGTFEYVL